MIHPINIQINLECKYDCDVCLEFDFQYDSNIPLTTHMKINELRAPDTMIHVNDILQHMIFNERNFYKLLIKRLHIVKPK